MEEDLYQELTNFLRSEGCSKKVYPSYANTDNLRRNFRKKVAKYGIVDGVLHYTAHKDQKPRWVINMNILMLFSVFRYCY